MFKGIAQKSYIDSTPYTSLLYGTGGANNYQYSATNNTIIRKNPTEENTEDFKYSQQAAVLTDEVTHDGTDVLVYAKGWLGLVLIKAELKVIFQDPWRICFIRCTNRHT